MQQIGGDGGGSAGTGGAGANSTITNAVWGKATGGGLSLQETATGGAGGFSGTGKLGGAGGNAGAYLTYTANDTDSNFTGFVSARGGTGGAGTTAGDGGAGGTANATIDLTGGTADVTAMAQANAGEGGLSSSTVNQFGTANASATAFSPNGAVATAHSDVASIAGASLDASSTADAVSESKTIVELTGAQAIIPSGTLGGALVTATAFFGGTTALTNNAEEGPYAAVDALPSASVTSTILGSATLVAAAFGANAVVLGDAIAADDYADSGGSALTVSQTHTIVETFDFNRDDLGGQLELGFVGGSGSGVSSITLMAAIGTMEVLDQNFSSVTSANNYFDGTAVDLGPISASAISSRLAFSGDLGEVTVTLDVTSAAPNANYSEDFLLAATAACFATGTRILSDAGEVPVEALRPGMRVVSHRDGRLVPVRWVGSRAVGRASPVVVAAGAFGGSMPHRALLLSPDHAVFIEGALIPVRHLVNGSSVAEAPSEFADVLPRRACGARGAARGRDAGRELPRHRQSRCLRRRTIPRAHTVGRCARRNVRVRMIVRALSSGGSFQGNTVTSAFGQSEATATEACSGCAGVSSGSTSIGVVQEAANSRETL